MSGIQTDTVYSVIFMMSTPHALASIYTCVPSSMMHYNIQAHPHLQGHQSAQFFLTISFSSECYTHMFAGRALSTIHSPPQGYFQCTDIQTVYGVYKQFHAVVSCSVDLIHKYRVAREMADNHMFTHLHQRRFNF